MFFNIGQSTEQYWMRKEEKKKKHCGMEHNIYNKKRKYSSKSTKKKLDRLCIKKIIIWLNDP